MDLEIRIDGRTQIGKALARAGAAKAEVLDAIAFTVESLVREGFDASEDPYGRPWAPLKLRQGKPLRDTGAHLLGSLSHVVAGDSARVGFGFQYAHVHQRGATIVPVRAKRLRFQPRGFKHPIFARKVTIPARPMLPENGWPAYWLETVREAVVAALQEAAGRTP